MRQQASYSEFNPSVFLFYEFFTATVKFAFWIPLERELQMRRFKSAGQAQRFLAVYGVVGNLFRLGRHLSMAGGDVRQNYGLIAKECNR